MKKCESCIRFKRCNSHDKARGMACTEYKKKRKISMEDVKLTIGTAVIVYGIIGLMLFDFFSKSGY